MKVAILPIIALLIVLPAAHALSLSDATGLVNRLDVEADGRIFEVKVVSNFDISDFDFDSDKKLLTLYISSGLEDNLGELLIPNRLLNGNLTFFLDGQEHLADVRSGEDISFTTLNFTGSGNHSLEVYGTPTPDITKPQDKIDDLPDDSNSTGGGCLIATAAFGTELAPQVQQLRELRDTRLLSTESGTTFVNSFNTFYYMFSPTVADYERENPAFKEAVRLFITPMIASLSLLSHVGLDSEHEVLTYGMGLILLNVGMYVGIPASVIVGVRRLSSKHEPYPTAYENSYCQHD